MSEKDLIDLNKRSQLDLTLEMYRDIKVLKNGFESMRDKQAAHDILIATIKTQLKGWAILWGSVSALAVSIISRLIS